MFNKQDLAFYEAFKKSFVKSRSVKLEVEMEALLASASLVSWFNGLSAKIEESIKIQKLYDDLKELHDGLKGAHTEQLVKNDVVEMIDSRPLTDEEIEEATNE